MFGVERVADMNILVFGLGCLALVGTLGAWSRKHGAGGRREGERGGKRERRGVGGGAVWKKDQEEGVHAMGTGGCYT